MKHCHLHSVVLVCILAGLGIPYSFVQAESPGSNAQSALLQRLSQARERQQQAVSSLLPLEKDLVLLADFEQDNVVFLGNTGVYPVVFDKGHYRPGKFGRGFYFEMPQSNLLPPDIADVETNLCGFQARGGAILACVATNTAFGRQALRANLPGLDAGFQTIPVQVAWHANYPFEKKWTLLASCYVKGPRDGKVKLDVTFIPQALTLTSTNDPVRIPDTNTSQEVTLTGGWQRIACFAEADCRLRERQAVFSIKSATNAPMVLLADGFQCEQAAYYPYGNLMPTTWTPGGQSAPACLVSIGSPLRERFPTSEGTMAFWTRTPHETNLRQPGSVFWLSFGAGWGPGWGMSMYRFDTPAAGVYSGNALGNATDGSNWHHVAMSWGATNGCMYKDGQLIAQFDRINYDVIKQVHAFSFVLGGSYSDRQTANSIMDDVAIFKRKLTDAEIGKLAAGQALHATASPILFSRGARSVYYRDENKATFELKVTSLATKEFSLIVDCSIGDLVLSSQKVTLKPGVTTLRFNFSPTRLKCGVYTCKLGALIGAKGAYVEFPIHVVPALRRDLYILSPWTSDGSTSDDELAFYRTLGWNQFMSHSISDDEMNRLGLEGLLYHSSLYVEGSYAPTNRPILAARARQMAQALAPFPNWSGADINEEHGGIAFPDAAQRTAWFDRWAQNEANPPFSPTLTNGYALAGPNNPDFCVFPQEQQPGPDGVYSATPSTFRFLDWWQNYAVWRVNALVASEVKKVRPDVTTWTQPVFYPGQVLDAAGTWGYGRNPEAILGDFEMSYADCRGVGKPFYATLGMEYTGYGKWPVVEGPNPGVTNLLTITPDDMIQQAWIASQVIPSDGLFYYWWQVGFHGRRNEPYAGMLPYAASNSAVALGAALMNDILPAGTMLKGIPNAQRPVALLWPESTTWFVAGKGQPWMWGIGAWYPRAWTAWLKTLQMPYDVVKDRDIKPGSLARYRAIIFPMAFYASAFVSNELAAAGARGTKIIVDAYGAQTNYPNMERWPQEYYWANPAGYPALVSNTLARLANLATQLQTNVDAYAVGELGPLFTNVRESEGVKYVAVINNCRTNGPYTTWTKDPTFQPYGVPQTAKVYLRIPAGSVVYEFTQSRMVPIAKEGDHWVAVIDLPPNAGRLLCLYPAPIERIAIDADTNYTVGAPGVITATILDSRKQPVPGRQLLRVDITDPDGNRHDESGLYRAVRGQAKIPFRPAMNDRPGKWQVTIAERTSGISQSKAIRVTQNVSGDGD